MKNTEKELKYIDIFAGCGGLSLGFFNSKLWKGVFAIEKSTDAFKTLNHNLIINNEHFLWPKWLAKKNHDINEILDNFKDNLYNLRGEIDLVAGGPPCQGFSTAGRRLENDDRNNLIKSYIEFIKFVQPKVIFFENVKGFSQKFKKNSMNGINFSKFVLNELCKTSELFAGYNVCGKLLDFSDYGIPQRRERFIIFGIRKDLTKSSPELFFNKLLDNRVKFLKNKKIKKINSLKDAISDLERKKTEVCPGFEKFRIGLYNNTNSSYQELMKKNYKMKIPDSHRFVNHKSETIKKFKFILANAEKNKTLSKEIKEKYKLKKHTMIPLSADTPTPTITTLPDDYLHYSQPRIFTVREYARIQSFNDWFEFKGKYTTGGKVRVNEVPRYSQIGNAIPPLFAEQCAIVIKDLINA